MGRLLKFFWILVSLVFLAQAFKIINVVPIELVFGFLGISTNPLQIFLAGIVAGAFVFFISAVLSILYSIGIEKGVIQNIQSIFFAKFIIAFLVVWLSFFTYAFFIIFGLVPNGLDSIQFLNYYIFWFIFIEAIISVGYKDKKLGRLADEKRITWIGNFSGMDKIQFSKEPKGQMIFFQGLLPQVGLLILSFLLFSMFFFTGLLSMLAGAAFGSLPIKPADAAIPARIIFSVFFFAILLAIIGLFGMALSKRIKVYSNCIIIPLPVIGDQPIFTAILPKPILEILPADVKSYKIITRVYGGHSKHGMSENKQYRLQLTLNDNRIVRTAILASKDNLKKALDQVIQGKEEKQEMSEYDKVVQGYDT